MARCRAIRRSAVETIRSTRFSAKLERESMSLAPYSLTWNQPSSVSKETEYLNYINEQIIER